MFNSAIPILVSLNEKATVKFYTEKLGFIFHSSWEGYLIFSRDGVNIHHAPCDNPEVAKETGCYVNVTEVDALYEEYKQHKIIHPEGTLQTMPWGMKQFSIVDNNGCLLHFGEDVGEGED